MFNALFLVSFVLSVIIAWPAYSRAKDHVREESLALIKLHAAVGALPTGDQLRAEVADYTRRLIADEWPQLGSGRSDHEADRRLAHLSTSLLAMNPADTVVQAARTKALKHLDEAFDARQNRRGLTPLFTSNMTPYGDIQLDTSRRLALGPAYDPSPESASS